MTYPTHERYHAAVVTLQGEFFGSVHGAAFRETLDALRAEGKHDIVLDLGETTLMDSSGIGVLIAQAKALREAGGDLRLARVEARVRNLFLMTRLLGAVFTLYPTVDEAVESFAAEKTAETTTA